ncbi:hypothetical protein AMAG_10067 [Allomyces macrogynus ATCC 38327]|uniref:Coiled-coil domain-containing protein 39 n=1 Tax=Allomyces macrogynus (strain ATCC 38327) TaxID=578462 RepID=A0A0L0SQC6_ALLM3|nr:hypothetical protein AMAG_10067 [Allomyces macrogynus ATCC 38327]|eukprot:KNE64716.1 hypothetical protein AMAG_10067 [Allomyces macrogynus ATCC 38327]
MLRFEEYGALPPFANESNKKLNQQVREKEARLAAVTSELDDHNARADALLVHMKNLKNQLSQVQHLAEARNREIETEEHLKAVADREVGRLTSDMMRMEKEGTAVAEQSTSAQNAIYRVSEQVAKIKAQLKSEEKELDDWLKVQQEKDEDNLILLKYAKEDDQRVKDLALHLEKLMNEVNKKRATLSQAVTESSVAQLEMERMADEFRQLHAERQDLLRQWEAAIGNVRKRDQQIGATQERYQQLKLDVQGKQQVINEKQEFLNKQIAIKDDTERSIQSMDRLVAKLKGDQVEASQLLIAFQDELEAHRTHLSRTSNDVTAKRAEVKGLQNERQRKNDQVAAEHQRIQNLQAKLKHVQHMTGTKAERAAELQEYLRQDEQHGKELDKKIKMLKEQGFRYNQELFRLRQDEKTLTAEISGAQVAVRNLTSKITKLDQESIEQRTLIYNQEYTLQQLQRKVKRAQGDRTDEEKEVLTKKMAELTASLEQVTANQQLLSTQLKRSQDDLRHAKRRLEVLTKEKAAVSEQIDDLNLYSTSAAHQLAAKVREKEEIMVEESILRLEVKKLRGFLHARADEVLTLESRRVQLHLALEERTREIELHKSMLKAQLRAAEDERYSACAELRDKTAQVDRLRTRYEVLMAQIAGPEEEEERSQAYYIIRAAQEREALQRQGDALDTKIQKAEREIKAMENTLRLLNHRNDNFKTHLNQAGVSPQDLEHRAHLQAQLDAAVTKYKFRQQTLAALQQELMQTEQVLTSLHAQDVQQQQQLVHQLEAQVSVLNKQLDEQQVKKKRAEQVVLKFAKELRRARGVSISQLVDEEVDMKAREVKDMTNFVLFKADEVLDRLPPESVSVVRDRLQQVLDELGIQPPSRPMTRMSNVSSMSGPGAAAASRGPSRLHAANHGPHVPGLKPVPPSPTSGGMVAAAAGATPKHKAATLSLSLDPGASNNVPTASPGFRRASPLHSHPHSHAGHARSPAASPSGGPSPKTSRSGTPLVFRDTIAGSRAGSRGASPAPTKKEGSATPPLPLLPRANPSGRVTADQGLDGRASSVGSRGRPSRPVSAASTASRRSLRN